MGSIYNTDSRVSDQLIVHLDATNTKSYPGSGTVWKDLSGNNYDFTLSSSGVYNSTGVTHMAFQGSNEMASHSSGDIPISQTNGVTYVVATRPKSGGQAYKTLTRGTATDHHVLIRNGIDIGSWTHNDGNFLDSGINQSDLPSHANNDWILMYFRWANGQGFRFSYNDTPSVIRGTVTNTAAQYNSGGFATLGNYQLGSQPWGDIALFAVWETELTDAQLTSMYMAYKTRFSLPGSVL